MGLRNKDLEELTALHSKNLMSLNTAFLDLQKNHSESITYILNRVLDDEKAWTEAIVALQQQVKLVADRINQLEEILIESGKIVRVKDKVSPKDRN